MVAQSLTETTANIIYPDSDGLPMSDNTKQFRWIVTIKENLELIYAQNPDVFVAGDLLWYPVEGNNTIRQAPDVMVAIGRPKGDRGSYQQWREAGIAPQVVFEILSPGNRMGEMNRKLHFYEQYGVSEYYIYDPDRIDFAGWMRDGDRLVAMEDLTDWTSPLLEIRFKLDGELEIYRPDGQPFVGFIDLDLRRQAAEQRADTAEQQIERLAAKLRELGIDPENI
ncbi:Uma2 family endonuclease [Chamaesiphon sp.]|uniref:Uma2 family endonuclease n=1 Tax=Chamaesiphon sp. TaxID=2814140 RepID=UPI0035944B26